MEDEARTSKRDVLFVIPTFNPSANEGDIATSVASAISLNYDVLILHTETSIREKEVINRIASSGQASIVSVNRTDFNHGTTRNLALKSSNTAKYIVFISQDVVVDSANLKRLVSYLEDTKCAMACGRQIARSDAGQREKAFRELRYPSTSGISTAKTGLISNFSNAFSVYSAEFLRANPFQRVSFGEDIIAATTALSKNMEVGYCSSATCTHSHHLSLRERYKRAVQLRALRRDLRSMNLDRFTHVGKGSVNLFAGILASLINSKKYNEIPVFVIEAAVTFFALHFLHLRLRKGLKENQG